MIRNDLSRRALLKAAGSAIALSAIPGLARSDTRKVFRIGYVGPRAGALSIFAEPDEFVMSQVLRANRDGLQTCNGESPRIP